MVTTETDNTDLAQAEGVLGGEFYEPRCIARVVVAMLEPYNGRFYDPSCGSGGMIVECERLVEAHGGETTDICIFGKESKPTTWQLVHMSLATRGIEANLGSRLHLTPDSRPLSADTNKSEFPGWR